MVRLCEIFIRAHAGQNQVHRDGRSSYWPARLADSAASSRDGRASAARKRMQYVTYESESHTNRVDG
jgi:hypothetical protein